MLDKVSDVILKVRNITILHTDRERVIHEANANINELQSLVRQQTTDGGLSGWLKMSIAVMVILLFVIQAVRLKHAHTW